MILHMSSLSLKTLSLAVLLMAASAAQADITVYTNQSAYLAAVGNTGVDSYDDLPIDSVDGPLARTAGAYNYVASSGPASPILYGAGEGGDNWLTANARRDTITFDGFSSGVRGVGGFFFGSNLFGDYTYSDTITLTATDAQGHFVSYDLDVPDRSSFLGFVSTDDFTQVTLAAGDQPGVWATANDLHLSVSAVPEPGTYAMLLAGLGLLGFMSRRRTV
ncbi:PEP-CTERM sorting domain-containing protein [Janthinobacterium sp. CG_23.3]|uniref:PEP-CTERM sorting domain-containing protein n=1 Tax=Janthinobacterium sp. CG_23.3 TaxID=3349634 RepID=UPI0038D3CBC6